MQIGDVLVVKGAKVSDFKGLTIVAYEDTSSLYFKKDQLNSIKRVADLN